MERVQTDPEMLRLVIALEAAIESQETEAADAIEQLITKYRTQLSATQTQQLLEDVALVLSALFTAMAIETRATQIKIATTQVEKEIKRYDNLLKRAGAPATFIEQFNTTLREYPKRVGKRFYSRPFPADQVSYRFRITTVHESAQNTVRNIIRNGNRKGQNPNVIAKKVRAYLKPGDGGRVEPLKEARQASRAASNYKPKKVRSGKIPYQAKRIARTESAETYRAAHSEMFENTILAGGEYDWLLSNSHAGYDQCDILARGGPYTADKRPHSHPNCLCTWSKRPPSLADVEALLKARGVI